MKVLKEVHGQKKEIYLKLAEGHDGDINLSAYDIITGKEHLIMWIEPNGRFRFRSGVKFTLEEAGFDLSKFVFDDNGNFLIG